jgi:hypothetical protein
MISIPSTTEVLKPWNDFTHVPEDRLVFASERGTMIHEHCAAYAMNIFSPLAAHMEEHYNISGYVESFKRWFRSEVAEVLFVEERRADDRHGYHGQIDLCARLNSGDSVVVDLKSPVTKAKAWQLQMAAYLNLYPEASKAGTLRLHPGGKVPKMDWYDKSATEDFAVFLSCLNAHRFFA